MTLRRTHLKLIAIIAMAIDHIGLYLGNPIWANAIGMLTFPIMAYFLIQGLEYTRSLTKYFMRMFIIYLVSMYPVMLTLPSLYQTPWFNIFYTLIISMLMIVLTKKFPLFGFLFLALAMCVTALSDWGIIGPLLVFLIYVTKANMWASVTLPYLILGIVPYLLNERLEPAIYGLGIFMVPILFIFYKEVKVQESNWFKWFYYIFYPAHLIFIWIIVRLIIASQT